MLFQIIATVIWASAFIAAKYTYEMMDPVLMVQCRFFIASIIMLPGFFAAYKRVPKDRLKIMWLLALINFPLMFLLQFIGLYFTSAASAVTMLGMIPLLTVLIGFLFFKRRINKIDLLLSLVALAGIILTVVGGGEDNLINPWGCLLVLGVRRIILLLFIFIERCYAGNGAERLYQRISNFRQYFVFTLHLRFSTGLVNCAER
ncbi:DMT family transporter [Basfia succiniciproducens]|uniref:DMT family transporter n=1 Tax=Basfia succiniciproducens TaxID=653940 RepID=UPI003FCD6B52